MEQTEERKKRIEMLDRFSKINDLILEELIIYTETEEQLLKIMELGLPTKEEKMRIYQLYLDVVTKR